MIRWKTANQIFRLGFKPDNKDYKRTTNIRREKRLARLEKREPKEEKINIPPIHISLHKLVYVVHFEDVMDVPTQGLATMGINTLEQDGGKVKSHSKMMEEEEFSL